MSPKKRILLVNTYLTASGGGNLVAAYIIEAIKNKCSISTLSWAPAELDAMNHTFGTSILPSETSVYSAPILLRILVKFIPFLSPIKYAILLRICKKIRCEYDIIIGLNNEADFGFRGIQYIHDPPYWLSTPRNRRQLSVKQKLRFINNLWTVFKGKYRPWMFIAGFSYDRMRKNLTLVNSNWTRKHIATSYGIKSVCVNPPASGFFPNLPWEERENGFVCIGRIIPWKLFEKIIEIINTVRSEIQNVHLHIIGIIDEHRYYQQLLQQVQTSPWISLHTNISKEELIKLIVRHRYGIHAMKNEPFGIAVAEMVRGGCIVFVPPNGGPMEIVGGDIRLLYETTEEAVRKILHVMKSHDEQVSLRTFLDSRKELFSPENFILSIQQIIKQFSK